MACDPFRVLIITDGTTDDAGIRNEVNLLAETSGFCLTEWFPSIATLKRSGVWSDSPITDGRRLRFSKADNVRETMTFEIQDWNADALITDTQMLRRLLEKARAWGTARWQNEPVWIEAQSVGETNLRYAIISDYHTPQDGDPYDQPFWQRVARAGMSDFQLILERRPYWLADEPGTSTATEISAVETYDGRNLGNVDSTGARDPTTDEEVYVGNKYNEANLSDLYVDNGGVFGANLMDAALPYNLLPAVPAVNDAVYFGIDTVLVDSGPFSSLVFDIGTAIANVTTIVWEYWNGAWVALSIQDNTDADGLMTGVAFDTTGVRSVHWLQPSDWVTTAVNGVTGYWVRARVTAIGGGPTAPTQQNRDVYSITWPYIETQASQIAGDIAALMRLRLRHESDAQKSGGVAPFMATSEVVMGLRSIDRGSDFTAYFPASDEQMPTGVTAVLGTLGVFTADVVMPSGRKIRAVNVPAAALTSVSYWTISDTVLPQYFGTYHVYLRGQQTGGVLSIDLQLRASYSGASAGGTWPYESKVQRFASPAQSFSVIDFGRLAIPGIGGLIDSDTVNDFQIWVYARGNNVDDLDIVDLILIPVDEWASDVEDVQSSIGVFGGRRGTPGTFTVNTYMDMDSVTNLKRDFRTFARDYHNDDINMPLVPVQVGPSILQANERQRIWILSRLALSTVYAQPEIVFSVRLSRNQRYISMRGNR